MKALRYYKTQGVKVRCQVVFYASDSDWENDPESAAALDRHPVNMCATVAYREPKSDLDCPERFAVFAHPNIPTELVLKEAARFIETLKLMYEL